MAQFCNACGTPIEEGMKFCSTCGATIAAEEPTVADIPTAPAPGSSPTPPAAAAKSKSPILKIVIIVVLLFVLIGVAGMGTCLYVVYRAKKTVTDQIKIDEGSKTIEIPTPQGTLKMGESSTETPTEVGGVPVYPGAKALSGGGQLSLGDKIQISGHEFETDDSVDQVVSFYKEKYGKEMTAFEGEGHHRMSINTGIPGQTHVVTIDVYADSDSGKTKIGMSYIGGKEAQ